MKKMLSWLGASLLLTAAGLPAQATFQSYYQWNNILNVDHGPYKKVKTLMVNGTPFYYAVGDANDPSGGNPMVTLSCINGGTGAMVFTKIITRPSATTEKFEVAGVAVTENNPLNPIIAVLCNHVSDANVQEALLYQFDVNGLVTNAINLGPGRGADVVHNPSAYEFAVLCEVKGVNGTRDYEITGIQETMFYTLFTNTYDWGPQDTPTSMVIDNGDIVAAGYTEVGSDRQIFMVRASSFGFLIWGQAFGLSNRRETILDVVFYLNAEGFYRYGFCGYDEITGQGLVGDVTIVGPQSGFSERYITAVNGIAKPIRVTAMARTDTQVFVCGSYDNTRPFVATFIKNANLTPQTFRFADDQDNSMETLNDIYWNFSYPRVVTVGAQYRNQAWGPSSPANQDYSWIMTLTLSASANCITIAPMTTEFAESRARMLFCTVATGDPGTPFTGFANPTFVASLDNCITPQRLAREEEAMMADAPRVSALYPNPGNGTFTLDGAIGENETALLRVTDMTGRMAREQTLIAGTTQQSIDLSELAPGVYTYSVTLDGVLIRNERLVIAR